MWGGLHPIPSRLALDAITLSILIYCALTSIHGRSGIKNGLLLLSAVVLTTMTAGATLRWTISIPMVPFVFLQGLRRLSCISMEEKGFLSVVIYTVSLLLIFISAALTILFPAVDIGSIKGKYNVGVIDLHLPVDFKAQGCFDVKLKEPQEFVTARLLYPTAEKRGWVSYFNKDIANEICAELFKVGSPPPLKKLSWMLRTWQLTRIPARRNAVPIEPALLAIDRKNTQVNEESCLGEKKLSLAVFSHGLIGNASIYSFQALKLASEGTAVLMIEHMDGSSIGVKDYNGSFVYFDPSIGKLNLDGKHLEYIRARRAQMEHRVSEFLSAAEALQDLNEKNTPSLEKIGISFVNKLDTESGIVFMGHSFGGGTAVAAATRRPDLVSCVVAHEPTIDWMPDDCRKAFFPSEKFVDTPLIYNGGTCGYEDDRQHSASTSNEDDYAVKDEKKNQTMQEGRDFSASAFLPKQPAFHEVEMLFLFSQEWYDRGWGHISLLKSMHQRGQLGPENGCSDVGVIANASHSAFSDSCMMMPVWLGRATGFTGKANPHVSAEEIASWSLYFIQSVQTTRPENSRSEKKIKWSEKLESFRE